MSADEMREYCLALCGFKLRVEVRLKNTRDIMVGRIANVEGERFDLIGEDQVVERIRFAWVARIKNA